MTIPWYRTNSPVMRFSLLAAIIMLFVVLSAPVKNTQTELRFFCSATYTEVKNLSPVLQEGKKLFLQNCRSCHALTAATLKSEHSLSKAYYQVPGGNWRYNFVRSHRKMAETDPYAQKILKGYDVKQVPDFNLTNHEIDLVLEYCTNAFHGIISCSLK